MLADPQSVSERSQRVPELDGLRGLAVLMVIYGHYLVPYIHLMQLPVPWPVLRFLALSRSGVELFFVLSGFLIGGILLDNRHSSRYFRTFYVRRFFRIIPLYLAVCLLVVLGVTLAQQFDSRLFIRLFNTPIPWYAYATFTQNFWAPFVSSLGGVSLGVTWSLAVEEHFYLTLPLVVWLLRDRQKLLVAVLGLAVLAAPLFSVFLMTQVADASFDGKLAVHALTPARLDELALGVLGAMAVRSERVRGLLERYWHLLLVLAVVAAFDLLLPMYATSAVRLGGLPLGDFLPSRFGIFYLCLLLSAVLFKKGLTAKVMRNRALVRSGIVAYGAYLLHHPILYACSVLILGRPPTPFNALSEILVTIVAFAATMAISMLSWSYFEKPLVMWGHRSKY